MRVFEMCFVVISSSFMKDSLFQWKGGMDMVALIVMGQLTEKLDAIDRFHNDFRF